jgi:hypothetical protein
LEHSAGIFWQPPVAPAAAAEQRVAAAVAELLAAEVAPDGPSGAPDAVVAAGQPAAAAARPSGAAAARASPSAEPDAAVVAVAQPGAVAQPVEFAAEAVAQPAEPALEARLRILAVAVAARLAVAPLPEPPALLQAPEPNRQLAAEPLKVPAPLPAPLAHRLLPGDSEAPEASSRADLAEQVSHSDSAHLEQVRSRRGAPEAPLGCPGPAAHWSSARLGLEVAHWGLRWWATAYLALPADQTACRECLAWLRD